MALTENVLVDKQELMKWVSRRNPDFPAADLAYLLDLPEQSAGHWDERASYNWD